MNWITCLVFVATITGAHLQCFTPKDDFGNTNYSTDLSGIVDFSVELYKELSPGNSPTNFFFSPYSIWSALVLAYFGAGGNTERQMERVLRLDGGKLSNIKRWAALKRMYDMRQSNTSLYTFTVANRAYFDNEVKLQDCIQSALPADIRVIDFFDTTGSAKDINNFVSTTTKGRITELVTPPDLLDALMVLVNAAFFKGTWKYQFKTSDTKERDFSVSRRQSFPLSMMAQKGEFRYGESTSIGARILELPYSGDDISMYVLLPLEPQSERTDNFANMVARLTGSNLREALNRRKMRSQTVDILLPKFTFQHQLNSELETALIKMGIVDLFDGNVADMSVFHPSENLSIDKTIHKAFVEVNEEGTEAAAATALISFTRSSRPQLPKVVRFHANEPFLFIIQDNLTRTVLFMGAIKNPR